jgi:hypothetical protein
LLACSSAPPAPLDLTELNQAIHRLTNALRVEKGLPPLAELESLNSLSTRHSLDMARQNFFDHTNPQGQDPFSRLKAQQPGLLVTVSGENIAMRSTAGEKATEFAQVLLELWKNSPEHYAHLVEPKFRHLGVGVAKAEDRIYATQTFASAVAELEAPLPETVSTGETVNLSFRFHAEFPPAELSAFMSAPDGTARIPSGDGRYYIGKGPIGIQWSDSMHFQIQIPTLYGLGNYRLSLGQKSQYYDHPFVFKALAK